MRRMSPFALAAVIVLGSAVVPASAVAEEAVTPQVLRLAGERNDVAGAVAVDAANQVYVAGLVEHTEGDSSFSDGPSSFAVAKIDPDARKGKTVGQTVWLARYNGSEGGVGGQAMAVAVDDSGAVYAAGSIADSRFYPNHDLLVVKFGPDGTQRWASRFEGPRQDFDRASRIAVDAAGNVYVSGDSAGHYRDWTTQKYSSTGTLLWERRHSGPLAAYDRVIDMVLASNGNVVVTGLVHRTSAASADIDTISYDPRGGIAWHRTWNGSAASHDFPQDMDVDPASGVTVTGVTAEGSPIAPDTVDPVTLRYDAGGTLVRTVRDGGTGVDVTDDGGFVVTGTDLLQTSVSWAARYGAAGDRAWTTPLPVSGQVRTDLAGRVTVAGTRGYDEGMETTRLAADGALLWHHHFDGGQGDDVRARDEVAGLALDEAGRALVTGTSWNGYSAAKGNRSSTGDDIVVLRFPAP